MAAKELCRRVNDDVGAMLERTDQVGRGDRVVDDEGNSAGVRNIRDELNVENVDARIADGLGEQELSVGAHGGSPLRGIILVLHEGGLDTELCEGVLEEVVGSAVYRRR